VFAFEGEPASSLGSGLARRGERVPVVRCAFAREGEGDSPGGGRVLT